MREKWPKDHAASTWWLHVNVRTSCSTLKKFLLSIIAYMSSTFQVYNPTLNSDKLTWTSTPTTNKTSANPETQKLAPTSTGASITLVYYRDRCCYLWATGGGSISTLGGTLNNFRTTGGLHEMGPSTFWLMAGTPCLPLPPPIYAFCCTIYLKKYRPSVHKGEMMWRFHHSLIGPSCIEAP